MNRSVKSSFSSVVLLACAFSLLHTAPLQAAEVSSADIEALKSQIQSLSQEVDRLKEELAQRTAPQVATDPTEELFPSAAPRARGLNLGFYGEAKYRFPESGSAQFDPHRFVLTPTYQINDWLIFNSEFELEHGGVDESGSAHSRFDGELELEQFYVDILINRHFNVRSLGIDLVPVGRINLYHEPTLFYSTERPEIYREIIPTTWMEPSVGLFGEITEGWNYQLMVSSGMEDNVSGEPGISAGGGFRNARPRLRQADESHLAYSGRLEYTGLPGFSASASVYATQVEGADNDRSWIALGDVEAAYRVPRTGLELRGELAYWHIETPENLLINNNGSLTDDVGDRMYGWHVEAAYHFWPEAWKEGRGANMELVPFIRYSEIVTQSGLDGASIRLDNGTTNKDFLTFGLSYFLNHNFVLKADYRRNLNGSDATEESGANQDYFQIGAGVFF